MYLTFFLEYCMPWSPESNHGPHYEQTVLCLHQRPAILVDIEKHGCSNFQHKTLPVHHFAMYWYDVINLIQNTRNYFKLFSNDHRKVQTIPLLQCFLKRWRVRTQEISYHHYQNLLVRPDKDEIRQRSDISPPIMASTASFWSSFSFLCRTFKP